MDKEAFNKILKSIDRCCLDCGTHSDDCLLQRMREAIQQSIDADNMVLDKPEFTDLIEDSKNYDARGLDLLQMDIENLCRQCPTHHLNCTVNKCRKCLSLVQYGKIVPFRDETAEDLLRFRGRGYDSELGIADASSEEEETSSVEKNEDDAAESDSEVIRLTNYIIKEAILASSSDIHIEPRENGLECRYRIDGVLRKQAPAPKKLSSNIISRVKILAGMDIAQKRIPQDGRFSVKYDKRAIDFRVSSFPSVYGEKIVLRVIDKNKSVISLGQLGFSEEGRKIFQDTIKLPNGIILITGPTGSGKSSTIYAALQEINSPDTNIITLEDPVEYNLKGITQGQINPRAGFTFASGLRSILRQDPDVILLGEIRDRETAEISMQASLTGHLVFSTLHTNSAAAAFMRLFDMQVEPFLIAASVQLIIAQRLVRVLCDNCKTEYSPDKDIITALDTADFDYSNKFYKPVGCKECGGRGYKGRIGIFEVLLMNEELRNMVAQKSRANEIYNKALSYGMKNMRTDGLEKAAAGITSLEEVLRVTQAG